MVFSRLIDSGLDASVVLGYTRVGYAVRARDWGDRLPSMSGKTVVVTGATGGLGKATTTGLAALGASVVAVGRNRAKLERLTTELDRLPGNVEPVLADLSLMAEIRRLATVLDDRSRIDVLINSVGTLFTERRLTEEGIEATLATNLLGQFLLTNLLIARLVDSAPARIVTVSSGGMYTQRISVSDLEYAKAPWNGSKAYARTKRGQVILSEVWAEKLAGTGVISHAMHPGWADTPGVSGSLPTFRKVTGPLLRSPEQGADTVLWLAAAPEPTLTSGQFWHDRRPRPTHRTRRTMERPDARVRLWDTLAELSGWDGELGVPS